MTTTKETVPTEQKFYNRLIVNLTTLELKDKTVENYYTQIKNNFYCAVKAHYLIARDLFDAKTNLKNNDYSRLVETLKFSGGTQSKYLKIGGDVRLWTLFTQGTLPMKWTSQYLLTQLTDEQFKDVQEVIDSETSAKTISEIAELDDKTKQKIANDLLTFLRVEIDKQEVKDISTFERIVERVKSALSKIPQIKVNDEKVETVKKRLTALETRVTKQLEKQKKVAKKLEKQTNAVAA
jgi:hypothetical protein